MEATSIAAILVILGLGYWMHSRGEEKSKVEANQKANDEFMSLANELEVNGITDDLVQWLEVKIQTDTGKGLPELTEELRSMLDGDDGRQQAVVQLMLIQQRYLGERQASEERMQWNRYVDAFRQMNKAQQNYEIEKMKKVTRPNSGEDSEKLHLLELIHLGDDGKTTDVMIGGVKLFTLKEK